VTKDTIAQQIYSGLHKMILSGEISPMTMLVEREVAEKYGVSRVPVREALHRLCQEGYLVSYPRKGYLINQLSQTRINQTKYVRYHLESFAMKLIIQNAKDDEIQQLREYLDPVDETQVTDPYQTLNTKFHLALARLSQNDVLAESIHQVLGGTALAIFQNPMSYVRKANRHAPLIDSLLNRDLQLALKLLKEDMHISPEEERFI